MTPEKIWLCFTLVFWVLRVVSVYEPKKEPLLFPMLAFALCWFITGWIPYLIIKFL